MFQRQIIKERKIFELTIFPVAKNTLSEMILTYLNIFLSLFQQITFSPILDTFFLRFSAILVNASYKLFHYSN